MELNFVIIHIYNGCDVEVEDGVTEILQSLVRH